MKNSLSITCRIFSKTLRFYFSYFRSFQSVDDSALEKKNTTMCGCQCHCTCGKVAFIVDLVYSSLFFLSVEKKVLQASPFQEKTDKVSKKKSFSVHRRVRVYIVL